MTIDKEFLSIFLDEAEEMLGVWEQCCLKIERSPSINDLNALFRSAHNLKGSSRSVGLEQVGGFIHTAEDLITRLQKQEIKVTPEHIAALLEAQKCLSEWITELRTNSSYIHEYQKIGAKIQALTTLGKEAIPQGGGSAFGLFDEEPQVTQGTLQKKDAPSPGSEGAEGATSPSSLSKVDSSIRVALDKIDQLIRISGELVIQQAALKRKISRVNVDTEIQNALGVTEKIVHDLQSESLSLRMLPVGNLFQRMERVCRDVARLQGKTIHVVIKGEDVELDKLVIERMKDPLVHILRNAVDHGLETSDVRQSSQKPLSGTVTISARKTPSFVTITVSDDGRGLGKERILKKAREKNLISHDARLSDAEIFQLIFLPSFSTAEKVTDVSGRGVGMDVVKRAVEELSGTIEIESRDGQGSTFTINLPSTLSIFDAVIIGVQDNLYAIPIQDISQFFNIEPDMIQSLENQRELVNVRGDSIPLEQLGDYLPSSQSPGYSRGTIGIIPKGNHKKLALRIDRLLETQSVVVGDLAQNIKKVPGFVGGTILANGDPAMIIDLKHVIDSHFTKIMSTC